MSINPDPDYNAYTETITAQRELIIQERKRNRYIRCCHGFLGLLSYVLVGFVSADGTILFCSKHNCTIPTIYNSSPFFSHKLLNFVSNLLILVQE